MLVSIVAVMLSKWVPIAAFSAAAVYSLFGMVYGGRWMQEQQIEWEASPKWMRVFFAISTFGQWRNRSVMKAWAFQGALFGFILSVGVVILLVFFAHPARH
jgi:hypothetical protein